MTNIPSFSTLEVFMQFLSKIRQTSWIGELKTFIKVRNSCPVVFHEEIIADFLDEKRLKLTPKTAKNLKFLNFQSFYDVSVKVVTDFEVWNV